MPLYEIEGPDGKTYSINGPEGATREQIIYAIQARLDERAAAPRPEEVGIGAGTLGALKRGVESFGEIGKGFEVGAKSLFGTDESTRRAMEEAKEAAATPPETPQMSFEDLQRIYREKGLLSALGETPKYVTETVAASAPQMATPLAVGATATAFGGPVVGTLAGIGTYGLQQFGNFLFRQAVEKQDPAEIEVSKAAVTAGFTAPLGYFVDRFATGLSGFGRKELGEQAVKELARRRTSVEVGKRVAGGATVGILAEAPTEVLEQLAERYQAGLDLTGEDANREYLEAFAGAAAVGGVAGGTSRGYRGFKESRAAKAEEAKAAETAAEQPEQPTQAETIMTVPSVDDEGNPVDVQIVRQPDGTVEAIGPDGEPTNIGELIDDPADPEQLRAVVEDIFGAPIPGTELAPEVVAPAPEAAAEPVAEPVAAPEPVAEAPAPVARPEPPTGPSIPLAEQVRPEEPIRPVPLVAPETVPEEDIRGLERRKPVEPPKTVPKTEEEAALDIQRKELEKERRGLAAPKLGQNMFTVLEGRLNPDTVKGYDVPDSRKRQLAAKQGAKMSTLEDLVGAGVLDDFTPENMRVTGAADMTPMELLDREQAAVDYLRTKIENNNPLTFEAETRLREIDYTLDQLERELSLDQINAELEAIAAEERAAGIETIAPPAEERGAPSPEGTAGVEAAPEVAAPPAAAPEVTKEAPPETTFPGMEAGPNYDIGKTEEQVYQDLKGFKNLSEVASWTIDNAPNPLAKAIAEKVFARIEALERAGIPMKFKIVTGSGLNVGNAGYVLLRGGAPGFEMKLQLNGPITEKSDPRSVTGMKYDTVLHELIHAATTIQINTLGRTSSIVQDLQKLYNQVDQRMRQDVKAGVKHPVLQKLRGTNIMQNPSEILAWGLTDKDFQDYLKDIKLDKKQTAFSKMVGIVRDMFGLSGEYQTALESLVEINERLTSQDISKIRAELQAIGRALRGLPLEMRKYKMQTGLFEEPKAAPKKIVAGRSEAMAEAAEKRAGREMTAAEYAEVVAEEAPVTVPSEVRTPNTREELVGALTSAQRDKVMPKVANNTPVGLRLDINAGRKGVPAITIHEKRSSPISSSTGKVIGYDSVARINDVTFATGNEQIALKIAKGESKEPLQTMEGRYSKISPEEAVKIAKEAINSKDWVQVGVNPTRHSFFYDKKNMRPVVSAEEVVQIGDQAFAKNVEYGIEETYLFSQPGADTSNEARGQTALNVIEELGRAPQPETTKAEWTKAAINSAIENPKLAAETAKSQAKKFLDMLETKVFSSDAALNNEIRRSLKESFANNPEAMGTLLQISTSQSVHDDALANLFMQMGGLEYDPELYKYKGVEKKENLKALVTQLTKISDKYKLTQEQAQRVAHTAFEAKRLQSLKDFNAELKDKITKLRADARNLPTASGRAAARAEIRRKTKDFKYIHMNDGQIAAGLNLFNTIPDLTELVDTWNGMRQNAVKELVDSGLWSEADAEAMLDNVDYVPFYREDQLEQGAGPKEFLRSYLVQAREKKLKGSDKPVNDIFDNMARWTQYAIKRAVRNRQAQNMVNAAVEAGLAKEVKSQADGKNVVRVWEDGEAKFYDMADPLFMDAFKGLESVAIPGWKFMSKMSNLLRQTVVLYPLFSVSQVPQDSFAAMFTSGLKPTKALKIPYLAVKEFVKTVANRSKVHDQLKKVGVVGVKDFSAAIARNDAEITAGLKGDRKFWGRVKDLLEHISMASDNSVRQAVYVASKEAGLSDAEAVEKAFQIINFRNKGSLKSLALAGQVIPFFNAYLAAQHVALKTVSGRGISPQERESALKTLAATTASVMMLSLLYAMMVGGDDEYEDTPQAIRDRTFMIPGTALRIPIRTDIFSIPKILTENLYMLMTDKGSMDGRKFRDSMQATLFNSVFGPTPVPQAFKPVIEVGLNYNFFQQRPLIGTYQKGLETERQFNDSTSEFSKLLGQTGLISPIAADHLIRGMFGSAGGLMLALTNPLIDAGTEVKAPDMSLHDMIAALPGTSAFVARPNENALKADFYLLRDEVSKVVNTLNDLKRRSPGDIDKYLADEDKIAKLGLQGAVNRITGQLSKIRQQISVVNQSKDISTAEKKRTIDELRKAEKDMLKALDIKELRRLAKI